MATGNTRADARIFDARLSGKSGALMIETPRLILRPWRDSDLAAFAEQNADPVVMRFLMRVLTREESDAYAASEVQHFAETGYGKWAVEAPGVAPFIGAVGLTRVKYEASFTPAVEAAWRLNRRYWGQGYATEAAQAAIEDGFTRAGLKEIVAITTFSNTSSMRVMEKLGMTRTIEFDHPLVPEGHALRRHILYRLSRETWTRLRAEDRRS
jgi:ribosomal-protein-alanine N-acetyltransferase